MQFTRTLPSRWATLKPFHKRVVTAVVLGTLLITIILCGAFLFTIVLIVAAILAYNEWWLLVQKNPPAKFEYFIYIGLVATLLVAESVSVKYGFIILETLFIIAILLNFFCDQTEENAFEDQNAWLWSCVGMLYVGVPMLSILWLRQEGETMHGIADWAPLMILLIQVWTTDTFAYLVGRSVGGPKLAPAISPNKTWSGLIGGIVGSSLISTGLAMILGMPYPWTFLLIGAVIAIVAQAGDLFESYVKRKAGVKDSGHIIPGHGGLLDRIDGLLTAAPVFALIMLAFI